METLAKDKHNFNFGSKNFSFSLKNYYKRKRKTEPSSNFDCSASRRYCTALLYNSFLRRTAMLDVIYLFIYFVKSICNRNLFEEWIYDYAYSKEIFEIIQKFCWLLNASAISDKLKGWINDIYEKKESFCLISALFT